MRAKKSLLKIHSYIKRGGKEFIVTSLGQIIYLSQNIVQNKIFTTFFSTNIFGEWSLLVSAYTLVSMLPFTATDQGIYKVANEYKDKGNDKQLYKTIGILYFLFFIFYTIVFSVISVIRGNDFFVYPYLMPFLLYTFTEILKNSLLILDNAYRKRNKILLIRIFGFSSRLLLYLYFHKLGIFTLTSALYILFGTNMLILVAEYKYFTAIREKLKKIISRQIVNDILHFSLPLLTWAIFGWMQNMISRWYLNWTLDKTSVALYSMLTTLSYFVPNALYTILNAYIMPIVFQRDMPIKKKILIKYLLCVGTVLLLYIFAITILGKYVILILSSEQYLSILKYLPITTTTACINVLGQISTVEIYRRGETRKLIVSTIMPGLFMATVGYFLIYKGGLNGAVLNYMSGHIIYALMTFGVVFRKSNIEE